MSMTPPGPPPGPPPARPSEEPPAQPPMGWLRLVLQGSALTSSLVTPAVSVNGHRVSVRYGENVIPVHAGPNRIDVRSQWPRRSGEATLEATVPEGGQVTAYYAPPMHQLARGAIGFEPQKRPGTFGFVVTIAVIAAIVLLLVVVLPTL